MKFIKIILTVFILLLLSCSDKKQINEGLALSPETESKDDEEPAGIERDSINIETRPRNILLTGLPEYRLTPVYKMLYDTRAEKYYTGSNYYYQNYNEISYSIGNQWHYNFMPGFEAVYGYLLVNVSHYNTKTNKQKYFFETPVVVKTIYFPSFTSDTLNYKPVSRDYYMISAYDGDSNKDGFINQKDLRHFYYFDLNVENKISLIPQNYSVLNSEYDPANDYMYVFAQLDENNNGQAEDNEDTHIFWIDLKNPHNNGRQY